MTNPSAFLDDIKKELEAGRFQRRRGDKILAAFGYVRRRQTFVDQVNEELEERGLIADPPITTDLDLAGFVKFRIKDGPQPIHWRHRDAATETSEADSPAPVDAVVSGAAAATATDRSTGPTRFPHRSWRRWTISSTSPSSMPGWCGSRLPLSGRGSGTYWWRRPAPTSPTRSSRRRRLRGGAATGPRA